MKLSIDVTKLIASTKSIRNLKKLHSLKFICNGARYQVKYIFDGEMLTFTKISKLRNLNNGVVKNVEHSRNAKVSNNNFSRKIVKKTYAQRSGTADLITRHFNTVISQTDMMHFNNTESQTNINTDFNVCNHHNESNAVSKQQILLNENLQNELMLLQSFSSNSNKLLNWISETLLSQNTLIRNNFELLNCISNLVLLNCMSNKFKRKTFKYRKHNPKFANRSQISKLLSKQTECIGKILNDCMGKTKIVESKCNKTNLFEDKDIGIDRESQTESYEMCPIQRQQKTSRHSCCAIS